MFSEILGLNGPTQLKFGPDRPGPARPVHLKFAGPAQFLKPEIYNPGLDLFNYPTGDWKLFKQITLFIIMFWTNNFIFNNSDKRYGHGQSEKYNLAYPRVVLNGALM